MRRIVVGFMSTVSALVLLFSYHTSLGSSNSSQSLPAAGGDPNTPSSRAGSTGTNSEVVDQQSGGIDAVSGATVTSDGYLQSLQSAIDQAGL
jgi:hypothetical protein